MAEKPSPRRFEVSLLREKRWLIDCLARSEEEARARAEELYADETVDAVRVVRGRFGSDGTAYETIVLDQTRQGRRGRAPVRIAAAPDEIGWCETVDDLYGPASRSTIARLLRNFLDRYAITPTELLYHHRYIKMLEREAELMGQALQRVATHQARARGIEMRQRLDALDRLVNDAINRARDALASRAAPRFGEGGLKALADEVAALTASPSDRAFFIRFAVSRRFEDLGAFAAKLEMLTQWAADDVPAVCGSLADELAAGLLGAASLVQETLGAQPHLAAAIATLADIAAGRELETTRQAPPLMALAALVKRPGMDEARLVLLERVQRELASDKPLSRDDAVGQRRLFDGILDRLLDAQGLFAGGAAMVEAVARRTRRFGIVGGIEDVRFASDDPLARLGRLLDIAAGVLGVRQQRAVATYMAEAIERYDGDPAALAALGPRIEAIALPDTCKQALLQRLPRPQAPRRAAV